MKFHNHKAWAGIKFTDFCSRLISVKIADRLADLTRVKLDSIRYHYVITYAPFLLWYVLFGWQP